MDMAVFICQWMIRHRDKPCLGGFIRADVKPHPASIFAVLRCGNEFNKSPLKQGMSRTGAIDQHGNIEAIGGVNEKIEGFFDACQYNGLTGDQGVVIPKSNAGDLMLREDVVEACKKGEFFVYAVETIHEALSLMTGHEVGELDEEGNYPAESLLGKAVEKAHQYWRLTLSSPAQFTRTEEAPEGDAVPTPPPISIRDDV